MSMERGGAVDEAGMDWIDVGGDTMLKPGGMREVEAAGRAVLLYDLGGTLHATQAICSHHAAWLSEGRIEGDLINCPRHQGQFHIPTGAWRRGPTCPALATYVVKVENGRIWLALPALIPNAPSVF